ncbi:autocrine proliferation repressor protein A-like [Liolophura sinensis]|uniref:autocrine proliferation repressor protein A-like n=1 Tax=Liolophura sinensis TaxID=3198878 RepID=UPI003158D03E
MAVLLAACGKLTVAFLATFGAHLLGKCYSTPLDDYVNKADPNYKYEVLDWKYRGDGFTLYLINMTSQQWLTENEVNHPIWWHFMTVAIPDELTHPEAGLLYISYGSNGGNYTPDIGDEFISFISLMAVSTGAVAANLRQVPNQPVVFKNDPSQKSRSEDAVIAWTWRTFVEEFPNKPEWLLRLPMTKAAVRAMDTITNFTKKLRPESNVQKYFVCGESKRGWTTWTTAAVDKRVVGIAPMVMDLLNIVKNLHHHYRSLGGWTFAFGDYYSLNFTAQLDNPFVKKMANIVDPFAYKDRLTMPKYIITTSGDEFFIDDDSYYYFDQMIGDKYLRVIPNAEHSLTYHRVPLFFGVRAFFLSIIEDFPRPQFYWTRNTTDTGGSITLYTKTKPSTVHVYHATTLDGIRRDFRLAIGDPNSKGGYIIHPVLWAKAEASNPEPGVYVASFDNPLDGWTGFYIQVTYPGPRNNSDFEFTSEVQIIPNTLPFPDCHGESCLGKLV